MSVFDDSYAEDRRETADLYLGPPEREPDDCGFCHGRPVTDAASWIDGKPRPPAPCPRCGRISDER